MPRPTPTHFLCAASGFILAAVCALSMSQQPVNICEQRQPQIEVGPHPRDFVQIREGMPYTVPVGHVFVLTAFGTTGTLNFGPNPITLSIDGQIDIAGDGGMPGGPGRERVSLAEIPVGTSVLQGSIVDVDAPSPDALAVAWGYLTKSGAHGGPALAASRVPFQPHPDAMRQVVEGTPLIVPQGKLFVLTALGGITASEGLFVRSILSVNGEDAVAAQCSTVDVLVPIVSVPDGLVVGVGAVVEVREEGTDSATGVAWGYLADQ